MEYDVEADEQVSAAIVRAVSAVEGRKPGSLPPLADVLDPTALDDLFDPRFDGSPRTGGRLSFVYSDCRVSVDNGEYLSIEPIEALGGATAVRRRNGDSSRLLSN